MAIRIYTGMPGSGKSLKLADKCLDILARNKRIKRKSGITRQIYSNMKFSDELEIKYDEILRYWTDPEELVKIRNADIIWDEIATYLDSTQWANVPLELKRWLQLHRHYGIEIYGSTQDFPMVDISMRRLVQNAFVVTKQAGSRDISATKPPVKFIWGLVMIREIERSTYNLDKEEYKLTLPVPIFSEFLFITKKLVSVFDTTQELKPGQYPPLRHIERKCDTCGHLRQIHV